MHHARDDPSPHQAPMGSMSPRVFRIFQKAENRFLDPETSSGEELPSDPSELDELEPENERTADVEVAVDVGTRPAEVRATSSSSRRVRLPPHINEDFQRWIYERIGTIRDFMGQRDAVESRGDKERAAQLTREIRELDPFPD